MDRAAADQAIRICLTETHNILKEAERISRAALACAEAGSVSTATAISDDLRQLLHDAGHLHDAASLLNRLADQ